MGYDPQCWEEYIGQRKAVRTLMVKANAARLRGVPMGHTLIHSPIAGAGKTALARLAARELGGRLFVQTEPIKPNQCVMFFRRLKDGDVLFLDEIHSQVRNVAHGEWLLQYLLRGVIPSAVGEVEAPAVTLIGATTDVGRLSEPFMTRFEIKLPLEPYTDEEAARIALGLGRKIISDATGLPEPTMDVCKRVARAASNVPREMSNILEAVRDLVLARLRAAGYAPREMSHILEAVRDLVLAGETEAGILDGDYEVDEALEMAGFTADGLDARDRRYLTVMYKEWRGEPAGAQALKARLGEVGMGLPQIENKLIDKGFLVFTQRGRQLTPDGFDRCAELLERAA